MLSIRNDRKSPFRRKVDKAYNITTALIGPMPIALGLVLLLYKVFSHIFSLLYTDNYISNFSFILEQQRNSLIQFKFVEDSESFFRTYDVIIYMTILFCIVRLLLAMMSPYEHKKHCIKIIDRLKNNRKIKTPSAFFLTAIVFLSFGFYFSTNFESQMTEKSFKSMFDNHIYVYTFMNILILSFIVIMSSETILFAYYFIQQRDSE